MELDYDLDACLRYNPQDGITPDTIAAVLAVWEGENDGDDWRWVIRLNDGRFAFIQGGCDYTGWDCQSWATSVVADTAERAATFARGEDTPALFGSYMKNATEVYDSLLRQITDGKSETWREQKDRELGVVSGRTEDPS